MTLDAYLATMWLMRTPLRTLVLAFVMAVTVSAGAFAAAADWTKISVQQVPAKVMTGYQKLFVHTRIMKVEKSGSGPAVLYRMTIQRKGKPEAVIFDAQGRSQR
jgi:hypothetical protein